MSEQAITAFLSELTDAKASLAIYMKDDATFISSNAISHDAGPAGDFTRAFFSAQYQTSLAAATRRGSLIDRAIAALIALVGDKYPTPTIRVVDESVIAELQANLAAIDDAFHSSIGLRGILTSASPVPK